ncbi:BspA family leucine-rich repeat surface protein [Kaistella antarctica]|uniref:Bacterial surface protein 26-residue repeat n=1 Tax=Kaistella antarctica TaxID=266748 RepID=A0A448NSP9_9FLAO|nr:BspA family leucine-rich repeat surface protein [Kaistella antarctica]SEV81185.1 Por secretion system C-terminal sorting domain-containing protein [Kaistella antarctica]VEI00287.1 bacterial surface protein 26-residue repeat [Kaistella antarctica]
MLKKFYFLSFFAFAFLIANAQRPLIFKFFVSDASDAKIRLTTQGDYTYSYVKSNNATITGSGAGISGLTEFSVPQIGTYLVSIVPSGIFRLSSTYQYNSDPDKDKITEIIQWGDVSWNSDLSFMFYDFKNLQITATDIPDFSKVTNMSSMFNSCTNFSIANNINSWNVGNVTDMNYMFASTPAFNKNIGSWDVGKLQNMSGMFSNALLFNQNIGVWNVSNVTNMNYTFYNANAFNQNIAAWNVSNVNNMSAMFLGAYSFNQNISGWNVSNVTDFSSMFQAAYVFNQNISSWDVSNALTMSSMFYSTQTFNQNLGNWQLSPVVTMTNIFDSVGMDCNNFGATLKGWAENPNTPLGRLFGVSNRSYGTGGQQYMNQLIDNKGWTFSGATYYDENCGETFLKVENLSGNKNTISLYPNPATEVVFIKSEQKTKNVQVFDTTGKVVLNVAGSTKINVQNVASGIYIIKVTMMDGSQSTHKLIKK